MRVITCLAILIAVAAIAVSGEQQRVLRRVIKSTPTATNLGRIRLVHVRSSPASSGTETGAVAEISSKEAANFGQRSANETSYSAGTKTAAGNASSTTTTTTTTTSTQTPSSTSAPEQTTTPTAAPAPAESTSAEPIKPKASERQQQQPSPHEVELLSSAPSSWQMMTAVEAPAAMLIATGTRSSAATSTSDLSSSSSDVHASDESATGDFLRASATKGGASYSTTTQHQSTNAESFSRLRQQHTRQQQSYFYPQQQQQQQQVRASKTSNYQGTKTWYQPPSTTTTTTTPRPAPLIQQQQEQQYEQLNEQYVEQQAEYGAAPLGQAEPFAFDFRTQDNSGNGQYRKEESDKNGVVRGSYGYTDANGIYRHVDYVADHNGFRANIKSNEPGLIGETQPASIQLAGGATPPVNNQRLTNPEDGVDWATASATSNTANNQQTADLALAPPDFESSHKSDRLRSPRHFRN